MRTKILLLLGILLLVPQSCKKEENGIKLGREISVDDVYFSLQGGTQTVKIKGLKTSTHLSLDFIKSMDDNYWSYNDDTDPSDKDLGKGIVSSHEIEGISVIIRPNATIEITVSQSIKPRTWQVQFGCTDFIIFGVHQQ
jgi:hypothetical protein